MSRLARHFRVAPFEKNSHKTTKQSLDSLSEAPVIDLLSSLPRHGVKSCSHCSCVDAKNLIHVCTSYPWFQTYAILHLCNTAANDLVRTRLTFSCQWCDIGRKSEYNQVRHAGCLVNRIKSQCTTHISQERWQFMQQCVICMDELISYKPT